MSVGKCNCGGVLLRATVEPAVPGAVTVVAEMCPQCDRRKCEACDRHIQSATARKCVCGWVAR